MSTPWQRLTRWLIGLVIVALIGSRLLVWWTDWLWFGEVGYRAVFVRVFLTRAVCGGLGAALGVAVLLGNLRVSRRVEGPPRWAVADAGEVTGGPVLWALLPTLLTVAGLVYGTTCANLWEPYLLWRHSVPTGSVDPVFGRDMSFYLTRLGFWLGLQKLLFGLFVTALACLYFRYADLPRAGDPEALTDFSDLSPAARQHLSALGAVVFALGAWGLWLGRFQLLVTSRTPVLTGLAYTDDRVRLPALTLLSVLALVGAVVLALNVRRRSLAWLGWSGGGFAAAWLLAQLAAVACQTLIVKPNEIDRERPYLERCIAATREALGLAGVANRQYAPEAVLSTGELAEERDVLQTIPLWGVPELTEQVIGTESLRGYYAFRPADYDRYTLDGRRRQVLVTAREMQPDRLEASARNWVNRRLIYTHGFGLVAASAHEVGAAGEPVKLLRDIPPRGPAELRLDQPRIYFGELPAGWVVVGLDPASGTREFDYPRGADNVSNVYDGAGGIPLGGFFRRAAFALRCRDLNLLISRLPGRDSRILLRRSLLERLTAIAPFLDYDSEPYPVLADGRIVWLADAYTVARRYPYSQPHPLAPAIDVWRDQPERQVRLEAAYIRNSVKVSVDAYDGTVKFHVYDEREPLLATWRAVFPELFADRLTGALAEHIRYPVDLFALQAKAYARFHMTNPEVFYNGEDLWDIAREETTARVARADGSYAFRSERERITPYYVLLRLPGEATARFRLILPFTPASSGEAGTGRDNMIGWMAADCDPATYGRLTVFDFPKNTLVYGPMQVEALIDQDPEISQQMTLWSERGSRVIRGRLLVIPLQRTLLYVEPLYLTAERRGALPELRRVVVFYNGRVRMGETLDEALNLALSGRRHGGGAVEMLRLRRLARAASDALAQADQARQGGDLKAYGQALDQVTTSLQQMLEGDAGD